MHSIKAHGVYTANTLTKTSMNISLIIPGLSAWVRGLFNKSNWTKYCLRSRSGPFVFLPIKALKLRWRVSQKLVFCQYFFPLCALKSHTFYLQCCYGIALYVPQLTSSPAKTCECSDFFIITYYFYYLTKYLSLCQLQETVLWLNSSPFHSWETYAFVCRCV